MKNLKRKGIGIAALFLGLGLLAFWLRLQIVHGIPDSQFLEPDCFLYYTQTQTIAEHGRLPARDMNRWLPLGRDNTQLLSLWSYALAYSHKVVSLFQPSLSLYRWTLYAPTVCFCIGLAALCFFLYRTFGLLFTSLVGFFLATLPSAIGRSTAGFSDRDAWCWMLGVLVVMLHVASLKTHHNRRRWILTLASGFTMFLGGLSWEGFGVFGLIILFIELWQFLTHETEERLWHYCIWVLTFVPPLYLISPAYRSGYGFAKYLAALVLIPPLVLLGMRALRSLLLSKIEKLRPYARTLALGLIGFGCIAGLGYVLTQLDTFANTTVPLSQNALMSVIGELQNPEFSYWRTLYGSTFVFGSFGVILTFLRMSGTTETEKHSHRKRYRDRILTTIPLVLFITTTFFREPLDNVAGEHTGNLLFFMALGGTLVILLFTAWRRQTPIKNEITTVAMTAWFVFWLALTRDATRYNFFFCLSTAFFTGTFIEFLANTISEKLRHSQFTSDVFREKILHTPLKTGIITGMLALILFWGTIGGYAKHIISAGRERHAVFPREAAEAEAYHWMKTELPRDAIVAANFDHGTMMNVLGGVKTIIDQDHYLQHWIHLYNRHVFGARSEREALEFLKTHNATHLLLSEEDVIYGAGSFSKIGSDETDDRELKRTRMKLLRTEAGAPWRLFEPKETPFAYIEIPPDTQTDFLVARLKSGRTVKLPYVVLSENQHKPSIPLSTEAENKYGGVFLFYHEHHGRLNIERGTYLPPATWNNLTVKLFMREEHTDAFVQIYPTDEATKVQVKIWEIHYPSDIQIHHKYLETGYPERSFRDLQSQ